MHFALVAGKTYLQEGCQQLESLIRVAKAIAVREEVMKPLRELEDQWEALTFLKARAEEHKLEVTCHEAAVSE
ncbi:hypothetical protein E2562_039152 [Oryza meyeriana var. granulata]|uniref:Uncharacterized protein n=1 Tax=Oryza meyeriana var. granulata TaxID=110450 RepID=A0A6G1CBX8_9ORYZ|nr:hypothetical protein E2562_039152 [Oryza meyeriana var. granulata]